MRKPRQLPWLICGLVLLVAVPAETGLAAKGAAIYEQDVQPLTTRECARCHYSVFSDLRDRGDRHQLECGFCHQSYHTWRPGKPWSEVVPQCESCHPDLHGEAFADCAACHTNAHAPLASLTNLQVLERDCGSCHSAQAAEVTRYPSAHTEVACSACHDERHGTIPDCVECHAEPHMPYADNTRCLGCHPVHAPLQITYGEDIANATCAACHQGVARQMDASDRQHAALYCVYCHTDRHRFVPSCRDCHPQPHKESLLQKFAGCADCHGDPHALKLSE